MISITTQQWYAWITAFFLPFLRVLGLMLSEPVLSNRSVPVSVRVGLTILVTVAIAPTLASMPRVDPASAAGVFIAFQQLIIGFSMGLVVRIALTAAETAGQLGGLQMGLGFAVFFDPQSTAQTAVAGQFMGLFATLLFLSINGHALVISALAESFRMLPVAAEPIHPIGLRVLLDWSGAIFSIGLLIALPIIAALLVANVAIGIMTRAAPQLNIFAVGFPITLVTGFLALYLAIPYIGPALERLFEQSVSVMLQLIEGLR